MFFPLCFPGSIEKSEDQNTFFFDLFKKGVLCFSLQKKKKKRNILTFFSFSLFQGNLFDFLRLTGWRGSKVLYFGDHLYSDLAVSSPWNFPVPLQIWVA